MRHGFLAAMVVCGLLGVMLAPGCDQLGLGGGGAGGYGGYGGYGGEACGGVGGYGGGGYGGGGGGSGDGCKSCDASASTIDAQDAYLYCDGVCQSECDALGVEGFSASVFKFVTIIPDDGTDVAGGWQQASASLKIVRWTKVLPESWFCPVTVGMPLRTAVDGTVSASRAAQVSAKVATGASVSVMHKSPNLPPGIYCSSLITEMKALFATSYPTLGARVQ